MYILSSRSSSETQITDLNLIDTPWAFRLHEKRRKAATKLEI
jgi:hypothetical protein